MALAKMVQTMLQEDLDGVSRRKESNRDDIIELFYQRVYTIIEHIKYDINTLKQATDISSEDIKELYMVTDIYAIQLEEAVDRIKAKKSSF